MSFAAKFAPKGNKGSFVAQIIRDKAMVCELLFPAEGKIPQTWYIIQIDAAKTKEFKQHMSEPIPITLTDYGTVLYSGFGAGPADALKAELCEKYGLYEN